MKMSTMSTAPALPNLTMEKEDSRIDFASITGKFGWAPVDGADIPYLLRKEDQKYTAFRIAEQKLLQQFKALCHPEVYSCFDIHQVQITEAEARLLNEINHFHCNGLFGNYPFTVGDYMLKVIDVERLYRLFVFLKNALDDKIDMNAAPCGFIQMDDQPPVPYVNVSGIKYSPMFYFEGAAEYLEKHAVELSNWELSYLKFCCKVQGIRQEFYSTDKCQVVNFEEIKKFLPTETKFTFMWPKALVKSFFAKIEAEKPKTPTSLSATAAATAGNKRTYQASQKAQVPASNQFEMYPTYVDPGIYQQAAAYANAQLSQHLNPSYSIPQNR